MKKYLKAFVHNVFIHPLMMIMSPKLATAMHNRNANWAFGKDRFDEMSLENTESQAKLPALGDMVYYTISGGEQIAAIVTDIDGKLPGRVDLQVFYIYETDNELDVEYSEFPKIHCWNWPPRAINFSADL